MDTDQLKRLLFGEERRRVTLAVLLAGVLMAVNVIIARVELSHRLSTGDYSILFDIQMAFTLFDLWEYSTGGDLTLVYGYFTIAGLAAIHAYFNSGYLISVLLAIAPVIGGAVWTIYPFEGYIAFTPGLAFERVFPEAPITATLGFLLGFLLREMTHKRGTHPSNPNASNH